jgi:restriction system protein
MRVWYERRIAVPDYQTLMRPTLAVHETDGEMSQAQLRDRLADLLHVSPDEREELLPSGTARRFANRVGWATTYLVSAGLLERPARGVTRLTERGRTVLREYPERVDNDVLWQFEEFRQFRSRGKKEQPTPEPPPSPATPPDEAMEEAYQELQSELAEALLTRVLGRDDRFL